MVLVFLTSVFSMIPPLCLCLVFLNEGGLGISCFLVNIFCKIKARFYILKANLTMYKKNQIGYKKSIFRLYSLKICTMKLNRKFFLYIDILNQIT